MRDLINLVENTSRDILLGIATKNTPEIESYLHGYCNIFAQVLNAEFNYPIKILWDDTEEYGPALYHAFCVRPDGTYVDAAGTLTNNDAETEFGDSEDLYYEDASYSQMINLYSVFGHPATESIEKAITLIRANVDFYKFNNGRVENL